MEQQEAVQNNNEFIETNQNNNNANKKCGHKKRENRFFDSADWAMNKQYQKSYHVSIFELSPPLYDEESNSPLSSM